MALIKTPNGTSGLSNKNYKCKYCDHKMYFAKPPTFVSCGKCKKVLDIDELIKI